MPGQDPLGLRMDFECRSAICDGIGDRILILLDKEVTEFRPRLLMRQINLQRRKVNRRRRSFPLAKDKGSWPTVLNQIGIPSDRPDRS